MAKGLPGTKRKAVVADEGMAKGLLGTRREAVVAAGSFLSHH